MNEPTPEITHLARREIQAPVAAWLVRGFAAVMGHDKAVEVAAEAIQSDARNAGMVMAARYGGNGMRELGRVVREIWAADDAITIEVREETERELRFDVVRCRYAELYERLGMKDLGVCLSCSRDGAFAGGFNPRIRLVRTQTIMEDAPCCDFRFTLD